jgi:ATP-dependent Clp protease ATP-binding subunit ClpA
MPSPADGDCEIFLPDGRLRTELFEPPTIRALEEAIRCAGATFWDCVRTPHLFMGLLAVPDARVAAWAARIGADPPRLLEQFSDLFLQKDGEAGALLRLHREFLSDNVIRLLREAHNRSTEYQRFRVSPMDLLISQFTTPNSIVAECFERLGVTAARLTELAVLAEQADPA